MENISLVEVTYAKQIQMKISMESKWSYMWNGSCLNIPWALEGLVDMELTFYWWMENGEVWLVPMIQSFVSEWSNSRNNPNECVDIINFKGKHLPMILIQFLNSFFKALILLICFKSFGILYNFSSESFMLRCSIALLHFGSITPPFFCWKWCLSINGYDFHFEQVNTFPS